MKLDLEKAYLIGQQNPEIISVIEDITNKYNVLMCRIHESFENYPELREVFSFDR